MEDKPASQQIDDIIKLYGGWKGDLLSQLRTLIKHANPDIVEDVKWKMATRPEGLPVWSHDGIVCIAETFKNDIKLVFFKGVYLNDSKKLFNARLKSRTDRAIEFHEGDKIDQDGLIEIVTEATQFNVSKAAGY